MISPISQRVSIPVFKNNNNDKKKYCIIGGKAARRIDNELDYQRKVVEQNERMINIAGIIGATLLAGAFLINLKTIIEIAKKIERGISPHKAKFESLENNTEIPVLDNCKSINKDLRKCLQRQVNQTKAGSEAKTETGEPKASNRLLLYGPAGVGKSYFAKIFAKTMDAQYMEVMYSDFNSKWVGEGVEKLKDIFDGIYKVARKKPDKKFVVTFNEIDSIVVPADKIAQNSTGTHWVSILNERSVFLNYMEKLKEKTPNVIVIGTTNISPKNNGLDRAAMSRFQNLIEVPYPDKDCLYEALKMNLEKIKNKDKFITENDIQLKELAQKMANRKFSFRNLEYIVNDAKGAHLDDRVAGKTGDFKFEYLKKAEENLKLSDGELEKAA